MIKIMFILTCFIVFAFPMRCISAQPVDHTDRESKELADCLTKNAMILDDGISDAATIAKALTFECRKEFQNIGISNNVLKYLTPDEVQKLNETYNIENLNIAIKTVLKIRSEINKTKKTKSQ